MNQNSWDKKKKWTWTPETVLQILHSWYCLSDLKPLQLLGGPYTPNAVLQPLYTQSMPTF